MLFVETDLFSQRSIELIDEDTTMDKPQAESESFPLPIPYLSQ
jgi:hypothetical protein